MLTLKDLDNRVYSDKTCIRFECTVKPGDEHWIMATFRRELHSPSQWNMRIVIDRTRDKDSEVYNFGYIMPRDNLPLELVAATGLKYFQLHIKEEVQNKSNLDFALGEILQGM